MKGIMKVVFLWGAVLAVSLMPGFAWGQVIIEVEMIQTLDQYDDDLCVFTVQEDMQIDSEIYCDRDYTVTVLSEELAGLEWISMGMNAGDLREGDLGTFSLATDATVYYFNDQRADPIDCYEDWEVTDLLYDNTDDDSDWSEGSVLSMDFEAGAEITLCENNGGSMYLMAAVSSGPAGPNLSLIVEGATFAEEGGIITLSANEDMMSPYQWQLDGVDLGSEMSATLSLSPTVTDDTGVYTLEFSDGEAKATLISNPVSVAIFPPNSLPVSSLLGLGLLALTSAVAGGTVLARMKK